MKLGDLSEVQPWSAGGPPPPGAYTCRVADAKEGESSGGYPQLELSWVVAEGDYDGAEIRDWLTIVEATRGKVVALLQATGMEIPGGEFELKIDDLIGRECEVVLRLEPKYNEPEKMVTRVAGYRPAVRASRPVPAGAAAANGADPGDDPLPF